MKVFRPWAFQGSKRRKNYFEGWYFKQVSAGRDTVYSFIPGISLSKDNSHSFVQVINGLTGEVDYFEYPVSQFKASARDLRVEVGKSVFSFEGIKLDLKNENSNIEGELHFNSIDRYPSSLIIPGIMGWYSFVPFMECKHGVVSTGHKLEGRLLINGAEHNYNSGRGYIEKDWGKSFPESWIWLHCNTFNSTDASFTFSVAKIPWLGSYFIGFISYLKTDTGFYNFSTWSKASIKSITYKDNKLEMMFGNKRHHLSVKAVNNLPGKLKAPVRGSMSRMIKETVDASIQLELRDRSGKVLFSETGTRAGLEIIDEMLEHFIKSYL
jgi:tocopherol cyclase